MIKAARADAIVIIAIAAIQLSAAELARHHHMQPVCNPTSGRLVPEVGHPIGRIRANDPLAPSLSATLPWVSNPPLDV